MTQHYSGEERRLTNPQHERSGNWHLDKTLNITHLLTTVTMVVSVMLMLNKMDNRITATELGLLYAGKTTDRLEYQWHEEFTKMNAVLVRIESKLDAKADKRSER
jgi:hypothetical protein